MNLCTRIICTLPVVWLCGCATTGIQVQVRPGDDAKSWTRYAWLEKEQPKTGDPRIDLLEPDALVRSSIEDTLAKRGFTKTTPGQAEVLLAYRLAIQTQADEVMTNIYKDHAGTGGRSYGRTGAGRLYSPMLGEPVRIGKEFTYQEGSLNIDFFDAITRTLVWHGSARKAVTATTDQVAQRENLDLAVQAILEHLPARKPAPAP